MKKTNINTAAAAAVDCLTDTAFVPNMEAAKVEHSSLADIEWEDIPALFVNAEDARNSEAETEANRNFAYLYALGARVLFQATDLEFVEAAPSADDPERIIPEHYDITFHDPKADIDIVQSVYMNQLPSFKRGINRRTSGDLCHKFRSIAYTPDGKPDPTQIGIKAVVSYLHHYPVTLVYDKKTRPDGTLADKPSLGWWFPEDFTQSKAKRNKISLF